MKKVTYIRGPGDISPHLRGFYERVARQVGVDCAYVKQVALGERDSSLVEEALTRELTRIAQAGTRARSVHEVQFYSQEQVLLSRLVPFLAAALRRGDSAVVVATKAHQSSLACRLRLEDLDFDEASNEGRYVTVDAVGTLSIFMVNGMPEKSRFFRIASGLIEEAMKTAKSAHPRLAVFGEWVSVLCENGQSSAAIRLEQLWNELAARYDLDLVCGYEMGSMSREYQLRDFESICREHSDVRIQQKS